MPQDIQAPIRVLLVDDEQGFLAATTMALSRRGFDVTTAANGQRALQALAEESFDVAVVDVKMPGIDGITLFRRLKVQHPRMPVILLTGHGTIQQAFQTSQQGVFEYLTKPCDISRLADAAQRAARRHGQRLCSRPRPDAPPAPPRVARDGGHVLLVDDEPDFLDAMAHALRRRNLTVTTSATGARALALISTCAFDVAVVDARMPEMDGIDLLRHIKRAQKGLEVIMLTGYASADLALAAIGEGAYDLLRKPTSADVLITAIESALEHRRERLSDEQQATVKEILDDYPD